MRRPIFMIPAATALLAAACASAFFLTRPGDVSNPKVDFKPDVVKTIKPKANFEWPVYGYSKDRRRYLPVTNVRPPFDRGWTVRGNVLLEFGPVLSGDNLFITRDDGVVQAFDKNTGKKRWERRLGSLAAASPAYADGHIYVTILKRPKSSNGRVVALTAEKGKIVWSRNLPSRSESSPLVDRNHLYFGSENGTVYALHTKDGRPAWKFKADGAVKAGLALHGGKLYFGDYAGKVYAIRQHDGKLAWATGTSGAAFGLSAGHFYSTPAVEYGRVYIGNTDGYVYSFAAKNGSLAWRTRTGSYVYSSPAVAKVPGYKPTVYIGSYDGYFYALDARTGAKRWRYQSAGRISGGATLIGDVVYFSDFGKRMSYGLDARTGKEVFSFKDGAFNAVIADGDTLYLNGYGSLYSLHPKNRPHRKHLEGSEAAQRVKHKR